jgi:hypothetical protein
LHPDEPISHGDHEVVAAVLSERHEHLWIRLDEAREDHRLGVVTNDLRVHALGWRHAKRVARGYDRKSGELGGGEFGVVVVKVLLELAFDSL